jgi:hypothetical protein
LILSFFTKRLEAGCDGCQVNSVEAKEGPTLLGTADIHVVAPPSPRPETRNGWKAGGPINSDALFIGEVQSFLAQRSW